MNLSVAAAQDAMEEAKRPVVAMQLDVGSWLVSEWFVYIIILEDMQAQIWSYTDNII